MGRERRHHQCYPPNRYNSAQFSQSALAARVSACSFPLFLRHNQRGGIDLRPNLPCPIIKEHIRRIHAYKWYVRRAAYMRPNSQSRQTDTDIHFEREIERERPSYETSDTMGIVLLVSYACSSLYAQQFVNVSPRHRFCVRTILIVYVVMRLCMYELVLCGARWLCVINVLAARRTR